MVGNWLDNGSFRPTPKQPDTGSVQEAVARVRKEYGEEPGLFEFVRRVPGKLTLAVQTTMKAVLG